MSWILNKGRKPKKEFLLDELAKEDLQVLSLAYVYAKNLQMYGIDITKAICSAAENMEIISRAHQQGYYDAMKECEGKYKDCVGCVLDKIRAEIEASKWTDKDIRIERNALASGLDKALEIIDKYKAESEDKEWE